MARTGYGLDHYYPAHFCSPLTFPKMARTPRSRRYCFTINNPTVNDETTVAQAFDAGGIKYLVAGREVGANGTPHLQGFVIFENSTTLENARTRISLRAHLESARGTSKQASEYCKKDGDFTEWGSFPGDQGRRSDLEGLVAWIDEFHRDNGRAAAPADIARHQPSAFLRFRNLAELASLRAEASQFQLGQPQPWQAELAAALDGEPDDRKIKFVVDFEGNKGKSWFARWYLSQNPDRVQLLGCGKRDDLTYAIDQSRQVFIFQVPRQSMEFLQYPVLEMLKDRMVFSTKYQSKMKLFPSNVHVVVMCNEMPDEGKMTNDRYDYLML